MRNAQRVERLFQIIKASCRPVMVGDQRRTGFGLPDAPRAVGLMPAQQQPVAAAGKNMTSALGGLMTTPAVMQTLANAYRELPQIMPQSANLGLSNYDPYANLLAVQQAMSLQNNMPNMFGYRMW